MDRVEVESHQPATKEGRLEAAVPKEVAMEAVATAVGMEAAGMAMVATMEAPAVMPVATVVMAE